MPAYSLLITSCNRHDLLKQTFETFLESADIPPREIIIVEDGDAPSPEFLKRYRHLNIRYLNNGARRGQIYSCDRLWQECSNDFAFWCEDDWSFAQSGFIKKSFDILDKHPEVLTVTLRGDWGHPLINDPRFAFKIAEPNWRGGWGGMTFNPGLRRKSDYKRIGSYGKHVGYGTHGLGHEMELSRLYAGLGYVLAALPDHCSHIGGGRSRAIEPIDYKPPKVLIAIPACHQFDYSAWESSESPAFDKSKAWKGEAYGTDIHISGPNPRIKACRDSWAKSQPGVDVKFFYGQTTTNREPLDDEVFLQVHDDYRHLPDKTVAIVKWAREQDYDYVLKCDDDTYVWIDRLLQELNEPFDYAGYLHGNVCSGGTGYWLSRRAMDAVQSNPDCWAEDVWVAKCMKYAGITPVMLPTHRPGFSEHFYFPKGFDPNKLTGKEVAIHAVRPDEMRGCYGTDSQTDLVPSRT